MSGSPYEIPERIERGSQDFLNCRVGEAVRPEDEDHQFLLNNIEEVCSDTFLQLYYEYPDLGPRDDSDYVDVVALSPEFGCLVINVESVPASNIEEIRGPDWSLVNEPRAIRPLPVTGDAELGVRRIFENIPETRNEQRQSIIPVRSYVALTSITRDEWADKFGDPPNRVLFQDDIEDRELFQDILTSDEPIDLTDENLRNALAGLRLSDNISGGQLNVAVEPESKRELLDFLDRRLKILTDKQLKIGLQSPDSPQQIRGIAGSGKTVVMAFRAAKIHYDNPDWNIAVTFRTHGLHQIHQELITSFYDAFSGGDDPDWDKLQILHGWGGSTVGDGMYSLVAKEADINPLSADEARKKFHRYLKTPQLLDRCCREVCRSGDVPEIFDAILIDEAQDLPQHFFRMCYLTANDEKRIYWAYDEAQNLATLEAQTVQELFGTDPTGGPLVDVSGNLANQISATHVMRKSFRTPRSVLMTAHGFGMGLYRDGPLIQTITNQQGWDYLGYNVGEIEGGDFRTPGARVTVTRPIENSPHPLWERQDPRELVNIQWEDSWEDEVNWVVDDIKELVEEEKVLPEEILVAYIWPYDVRSDRLDYLEQRLDEELASDDSSACHIVGEEVRRRGSNATFKQEGKITVSGIHYVGGNEAGVVYMMGAEFTGAEATQEQYPDDSWRRNHVEARNKAFVAMTRTKGWCRITGSDPTHRIAGELNRVIADTLREDPQLRFDIPPSDSPYKNMEPERFD